ncbi:CD3324 family protein [Lentibacillus salicampi]|uniref:CD3324 family protein n=1 Tax=Lentibacillus salicampi TaxID=175306 RepID=UPI001FD82A81|nr:CD3324 family protein [Lentibacillus salicampi]
MIVELQQYIQGETVYIPRKRDHYRKWGSCSGARDMIDERNAAIKTSFDSGKTIDNLALEHCLSIDTIKKIVYKK